MSNKLLTTTEAANLVGVCPDTIRRWTRNGKLPYSKDATGVHRYDSEMVSRFVPRKRGSRPPASGRRPFAYVRAVKTQDPDQDQTHEQRAMALTYFAQARITDFEIIVDRGSFLRYKGRGYRGLLDAIANDLCSEVVLPVKWVVPPDAFDFLLELADVKNCQVTVLNAFFLDRTDDNTPGDITRIRKSIMSKVGSR
jgi:excisionase family DNA binding protein